jgi:hypothetical protein
MHASIRLVVALAVVVLGAAGAVAATAAHSTGTHQGAAALAPGGYRVRVSVTPNRSTALNRTTVVLTRNGRVVSSARVTLTTTMLDMPMPGSTRRLHYAAGRYASPPTVLGMIGRWQLRVSVAPAHGAAFSVALVDRVRS